MWWRSPERAADSGLRSAYRPPASGGGHPPAAGGSEGRAASGASSSGRPVGGSESVDRVCVPARALQRPVRRSATPPANPIFRGGRNRASGAPTAWLSPRSWRQEPPPGRGRAPVARWGAPSPVRRPARRSLVPLGAAVGLADGGGCSAVNAAMVVRGDRARPRACAISPFVTLTYHH